MSEHDQLAPTETTGEGNDSVPKKKKSKSKQQQQQLDTQQQEQPNTTDQTEQVEQVPTPKAAEPKEPIDILDKYCVVMDETLYVPPVEVKPNDTSAMAQLDDNKLIELREAFNIIDFDGNGIIDESDLKGIFLSMGQDIPDSYIKAMLEEAKQPLDFDSFATMISLRTIDLDSEEDLIDAFKLWDDKEEGVISEERIMRDLMTFGDRFSQEEAWSALEEAPIKKGTENEFGGNGNPMIEYLEFAKLCSGLRKKV